MKEAERSIFELVRPTKLVEIAGNARAKRLARGLLAKGPKPGVVVSGGYGTGKSTIARIFARSIVCEAEDPDKPCGACPSCTYSPRNTALWGRGVSVRNCAKYSAEQLKGDLEDALYASETPHVLVLDEFHRAGFRVHDQLLTWLEDESANLVAVVITPEPTKIEPALAQRLYSIPMEPPTPEETLSFLRAARDRLGLCVSDDILAEFCSAHGCVVRACLNDLHLSSVEGTS